MLIALIGVVGLIVAGAVVARMVRWQREGNEQLIPIVLLGLLIVEATIYPDQNTLPSNSIFHLGSALRLPEIYIALALVALAIARGVPKRIGLPAGLWLAFGGWMIVGAVEGLLYHNPSLQDLNEAKEVLYFVGAFALAAAVPVRKYIDSGHLFKLGYLTVVCLTIIDLMSMGGVDVNTNVPGLPLQDFGTVGSETAALGLAIVMVCFLVKLASGTARPRHVLTLIPALVALVLADQRAVLVNAAAMFLVLGVVLLVGQRQGVSRRFSVKSGHVVLTLLAIVAVVTVAFVLPAAISREPVHVPLESRFNSLFHSEGKAESAQDRLNLASEAESLIPKHVWIGWGLGVEFQYYEAGFRSVVYIAYAHNIVLDLWLRLGLVGLLLYFVALAASVAGGLKVWRRHPDAMTAALALGLVAVLAGLTAQAFFEPFLDEYRLATLFGVSLGMLRAAVTSMPTPSHLLGRQPVLLQEV